MVLDTHDVLPFRLSHREPPVHTEAPSMIPPIEPLPQAALDLALAIVAASASPLALLSGDLAVIALSQSFSRAFGIDPEKARGRPFRSLGEGEWAAPQLVELLRATANGSADVDAYEMELVRPGRGTRCLQINAKRLDYGTAVDVRVALAVTDVTQVRENARQKDELVRERTMLLQELQHRVANSLQIIASVLMQSARRVTSDEARGHLTDAHSRVMSVAAVQTQLARTRLGDVAIRPYLDDLCRSIGASMIRDPAQLSIVTRVDDADVSADASVSMGLVVTELVINALKHAFPDDRQGTIHVDYHVRGPAWTLSVTDDGVGMPADGKVKSGLGTSIVEALAKQLRATIEIADAAPGTRVNVIHPRVASAIPALRAV